MKTIYLITVCLSGSICMADAVKTSVPFSGPASKILAGFVSGTTKPIQSAQCGATVLRPALQEAPLANESNQLNCAIQFSDGAEGTYVKGFESSPVEAWGNRFSSLSSFSVNGEFADELAAYLGSAYEANSPLWSSSVLCDKDFNFCIDDYTVLAEPSGHFQTFCTRWTELAPGQSLTKEDFEVSPNIKSASEDEQLRSLLLAQLQSGKRQVSSKFCAFYGE